MRTPTITTPTATPSSFLASTLTRIDPFRLALSRTVFPLGASLKRSRGSVAPEACSAGRDLGVDRGVDRLAALRQGPRVGLAPRVTIAAVLDQIAVLEATQQT